MCISHARIPSVKVKELISKLQQADGELEVFAARLTFIPIHGGGVSSSSDFMNRHPIDSVSMVRDMEDPKMTERIIIAFDDSETLDISDAVS